MCSDVGTKFHKGKNNNLAQSMNYKVKSRNNNNNISTQDLFLVNKDLTHCVQNQSKQSLKLIDINYHKKMKIQKKNLKPNKKKNKKENDL